MERCGRCGHECFADAAGLCVECSSLLDAERLIAQEDEAERDEARRDESARQRDDAEREYERGRREWRNDSGV
jgi:hypothetical protein